MSFRVCLARLYGGGPPLCIPPSLIPTPTHPLTPGFPTLAPKHDAPPGHHPVTTRFLLSLLATSIYLSIPSTAVEALKCILSSIGPHTVIEYLDFAIGKPIRTQGAAEPDTAVGLENVAQEVKREHSPSVDSTKTEVVDPDSHSTIGGGLLETLSHRYPSCPDECTLHEHSFYYGPISSKIGEAAACWLAKWGPDILKIEEKGLNAQPRPTSAGGSFNVTVPEIWGRGGLSAKWVCALVSSDLLFIRGERERYEFAKSIVEFRRQGGLDDAEEDEWTKMFDQGIYYSNMVDWFRAPFSLPLTFPCTVGGGRRYDFTRNLPYYGKTICSFICSTGRYMAPLRSSTSYSVQLGTRHHRDYSRYSWSSQ